MLYLSLYCGVDSLEIGVDKGFELAEVKGHPQDNAIQWVSTCIKQLSALQEQKEQQEQDEQSQDDSSD